MSQITIETKPWEQMSDSERLAHLRAHSQPRPLDWRKFREAIREKAKRSQRESPKRSAESPLNRITSGQPAAR